MPPALDVLSYLYLQAWSVLGLVLLYYVILSLILRARKRPSTDVVRYEPPPNISPAVAAALNQNGRYEVAFVSALVSLSAKRALRLQQRSDSFRMTRLSSGEADLSHEESAILRSLFLYDDATYTFNRAEYSRLCSAYFTFRQILEGLVEPELISAHPTAWWIAVSFSGAALLPVAASLLKVQTATSLASLAFYGVCFLLSGSSLVSAIRVWPLTLRKLYSYIPWDDRPSRPLAATDLIPFVLTGSALFGFVILSVLTSTEFACLLAAALLLNLLFRAPLHSPTSEGRKVLAELANFREFLVRTATDRLNRQNEPGNTPDILEQYIAYAVALDVEHTWGEELVASITTLLEFDAAYSRNISFSAPTPVVLHLSRRK